MKQNSVPGISHRRFIDERQEKTSFTFLKLPSVKNLEILAKKENINKLAKDTVMQQ